MERLKKDFLIIGLKMEVSRDEGMVAMDKEQLIKSRMIREKRNENLPVI